MAENTLGRFARLLAGVILTQGHLGHQVLGQLLIFDATEVEVAGANLAVAATARQRNAFAQVAIRTAVPALAVQALLRNREKRLSARERRLAERAERVSAANKDFQTQLEHMASSCDELERQRDDMAAGRAQLEARCAELRSGNVDAAAKLAALDAENRRLRDELAALQSRAAASPEPPGPATPPGSPPAGAPSEESRVPPPTKTGGSS